MSRVEASVLQAGDEQVLREWTRASSISAGLAQRARILLLAAGAGPEHLAVESPDDRRPHRGVLHPR